MATTRRMAPWARVGVVALIACLGLAVGPTARAGDVDQAQLGQAIELRLAFGLNADANYVASVTVDNPTSEWGVALTDFEAAELEHSGPDR